MFPTRELSQHPLGPFRLPALFLFVRIGAMVLSMRVMAPLMTGVERPWRTVTFLFSGRWRLRITSSLGTFLKQKKERIPPPRLRVENFAGLKVLAMTGE